MQIYIDRHCDMFNLSAELNLSIVKHSVYQYGDDEAFVLLFSSTFCTGH